MVFTPPANDKFAMAWVCMVLRVVGCICIMGIDSIFYAFFVVLQIYISKTPRKKTVCKYLIKLTFKKYYKKMHEHR